MISVESRVIVRGSTPLSCDNYVSSLVSWSMTLFLLSLYKVSLSLLLRIHTGTTIAFNFGRISTTIGCQQNQIGFIVRSYQRTNTSWHGPNTANEKKYIEYEMLAQSFRRDTKIIASPSHQNTQKTYMSLNSNKNSDSCDNCPCSMGGTSPLRSLFWMYKSLKAPALPQLLGIGPVNRLLFKYTNSKLAKPNKLEGIEPAKELSLKSIKFKFVNRLKAFWTLPVNSLSLSNKKPARTARKIKWWEE